MTDDGTTAIRDEQEGTGSSNARQASGVDGALYRLRATLITGFRMATGGCLLAMAQACLASGDDRVAKSALEQQGSPKPQAPAATRCSPAQDCLNRCKSGEPESCVRLGEILLRNAKAGDKQAEEAALQLWTATCQAGFPEACTALAGAQRRRKQFADALRNGGRACVRGSVAGCTEVGKMAWLGSGVAKSADRAMTLWNHACLDGDAEACAYELSLRVRSTGTQPSALDQYDSAFHRACLQERGLACVGWALVSGASLDGSALWLPADPDAVGVAVDTAIRRPLKLYLIACHEGHAEGCSLAARLIKTHSERFEHQSRALSLLEVGCGGRAGELPLTVLMRWDAATARGGASSRALACFEAATTIEEKGLDSQDQQKAQGYLDKACAAGLAAGCRQARFSTLH